MRNDTQESGRDRCPNCGKVGSHHLAAGESGAEIHEFHCDNEKCRVAYYEVDSP